MSAWIIEARAARKTFAVGERVILELDARRQGKGSVPLPAFAGGTAPVSFWLSCDGEEPTLYTLAPAGERPRLPGGEPRADRDERARGTIDLARVGTLPAGSYEAVVELGGARSNPVAFVVADPGPVSAVAATQNAAGLGLKTVLRVEERPDGLRLVVARPAGAERPATDLGPVAREAQLAIATAAPETTEARTWAVALEAGGLRAAFVDALGGVNAREPLDVGVTGATLVGAACGETHDPDAGAADTNPWPDLHVALHGSDAAGRSVLALVTIPARSDAPPRTVTRALPSPPIAGALAAIGASERLVFVAATDLDGLGFAVSCVRWTAEGASEVEAALRARGRLVALAAVAPRPGRGRVVALVREGGTLSLHDATATSSGPSHPLAIRVAWPTVPPSPLVEGLEDLRLAIAGESDERILGVQGDARTPALVTPGAASPLPLPDAAGARFWDVELTRFGPAVLWIEPEDGVASDAAEKKQAPEGLEGLAAF